MYGAGTDIHGNGWMNEADRIAAKLGIPPQRAFGAGRDRKNPGVPSRPRPNPSGPICHASALRSGTTEIST
jgi:hypothetical protein